MANQAVEQCWAVSDAGRLPVVIDVSSCAYTLHQIRPVLTEENKKRFDRLRFLDSVTFLHELVLPRVTVRRKKNTIVLHPVCSLEKMKMTQQLIDVAREFAHNVHVPAHAGCCGMAGDRGFLFPELTASAT